jgi:hypothetical protein
MDPKEILIPTGISRNGSRRSRSEATIPPGCCPTKNSTPKGVAACPKLAVPAVAWRVVP